MTMHAAALAALAGFAASASAQYTTVLFNSFETAIRADLNEFATASVGSTTTESLYPLNTQPLSPDPVTDANFNFVEFPAGTLFQPVAQFNAQGQVVVRFDSPQTGLGIIDGNFGFEPLEIDFVPVTSSDPSSITGLPTTGDGRGSIVTQDTTLAVDPAFAVPNGFGTTSALAGLNFVGGDPSVETNFELFFQDVNNFGGNGPVDFSTGPSGSQAAFFTGESLGDFIGIYPAFALAGFLADLELVNTTVVQVEVVQTIVTPLTDPNTGEILVDVVTINDAPVSYPRVEVTTNTVIVDRIEGDIRADANYDGVVGETENIGSQAYEFNDTDGSIILQFDAIGAADTEGFSTLELCFHWARNITGYEDENATFFTNDIDGDGEDDLLIDTNNDGVPDATGNQQPDSLRIYANDVLLFEASTEARVQEIVDGASVRRLANEFGITDPSFNVQNPATWPQDFFDFVDARDGALDGVLGVVTGPLSDARVLRNIDNGTDGGSLPVQPGEGFYAEILDISDFIGQEITITVVGTTTAADETLVFDHLLVRGASLGCSPADLAEPFGTLDVFDILGFFDLFGQSDAAADLAAPFGSFDVFDILGFFDLFGQGC